MKYTLIFAALLMSSTAALADSAYLGFAAGSASQKLDIRDQHFSDNSTSARLFGGNQITPYLGIEFGYTYFGEVEIKENGAVLGAKPKAFYAALTGNVPVWADLSVTGKLGVARSKVSVLGELQGATGSADVTGTGAMFGVGLQYKIGYSTWLVADYENYGKILKDSDTMTTLKATNITLGVRGSF